SAARAVKRAARGLERVAAERVRDELLMLIARPDTARALRRADALGVLRVVLPEIEPMRATPQPAPHRFDVLEHSLRAVAGCDRAGTRGRRTARSSPRIWPSRSAAARAAPPR